MVEARDIWHPAQFYHAMPGADPAKVWGYEWRGLALRHAGWAEPRSATRWTLLHIGSGTEIMRLTGSVATVMPVAGEVAECSDWTLFDLPDGWKQTDPELPDKISAICDGHPEAHLDTSYTAPTVSPEDIRAVIDARENLNVE